MTTMMRWAPAPTKEKRPQIFAHPSAGLVVAQHLRDDAAECCQRVLGRPAKQCRPYLSPQAYSDLHQHGGSLGSVAVLMLACPESAQALAAHLQRVADTCSAALRRTLPQMTGAAIRAIAHHLIIMHQAHSYPDSPAALRELIASTEATMAALREQLLAAQARLADLERAPERD